MSKNYKQIVAVLYEEFGDIGLAWARQQLEGRLEVNDTAQANTKTNKAAADAEAETPHVEAQVHLEDVEDGIEEDEEDDEGYLDESYQDGEAFQARTEARTSELGEGALISPADMVDSVLGLIEMAGEVRKFEEAQVTRRVGIAADRDVALANIRAKQDLMRDYLARTFDERAENFDKLFGVIDQALETDNVQALAMGLESVVKLATSSPFKDLRTVEETAAALTNPDHEWEF